MVQSVPVTQNVQFYWYSMFQFPGYLIDKFGQYKFVMVLSLILNAAFHHSLLLIPHMETPGEMPSAYVTKHPETGQFEVC
jgi:hypothetical protein